MQTCFDCIPCLVKHTVASVRTLADSEVLQTEVIRAVLTELAHLDYDVPPPVMGAFIHRLIRQKTNSADPFEKNKYESNQAILKMYDDLKMQIKSADNPFDMALRLALVGNVIDMAVVDTNPVFEIQQRIDEIISAQLFGDPETLYSEIEKAVKILFIHDNAGEIVFDKLFIEILPHEKIISAVRGAPVINDATMIDAKESGLTEIVKVITTGSDIPGIVYDKCSAEFRKVFDAADLIISKGQGNYETLNNSDKNIFFLLKAKCPSVATDIGCPVGTYVIAQGTQKKFNRIALL